MFIERSAARIRRIRTVFLCAGLLPTLLVAWWALRLRSPGHLETLRTRWQQAVGVPLDVRAVTHPRPGVVRLAGCVVRAAGTPVLELPVVEVESSATEDRLRIDAATCDAAAARLLGRLATAWLAEEARFPRTCVIEVDAFRWTPDAAPAPLRVECVAQAGARAVRVVRRGAVVDEVRCVRATDAGGGLQLTGTCSEPAPAAVLAAFAGWRPEASAALGAATVAGQVEGRVAEGGWSGTARGRLAGLDLGACAAVVPARARGAANLAVDEIAWDGGRITSCVAELALGPGWIDAGLVRRMVAVLGCIVRGDASQAADAGLAFSAAGCRLQLDAGGLRIVPTRPGGALAEADGIACVMPPAAVLPVQRVPWITAPPGGAALPAFGQWLLSILPDASVADAAGRLRSF